MVDFLKIQDGGQGPVLDGSRVPVQMSEWAASAPLHCLDDTTFGQPDDWEHQAIMHILSINLHNL